MSTLWQLHPQYGESDIVWVLRDIDLVLGLGADHPELSKIYQNVKDRVIAILSENPEFWWDIRNSFFRAKDSIVGSEVLSNDHKQNMVRVDSVHWEYERLMFLRQLMLSDPRSTLQALAESIEVSLQEFPLNKEGIMFISEHIDQVTKENFLQTISDVKNEFWHIGIISFYEGCIAEGKYLDQVISCTSLERDTIKTQKKTSMSYWDFTNVVNLATTKKQFLDVSDSTVWGKSFVLSWGAGNAFAQLSIIQKYVENGGKIRSISGTSLWSAIGILVGKIGNDAVRLQELMNDLVLANESGEIPEKILGNELKMIGLFDRLLEKYGVKSGMTFLDLKFPVIANAGRQYKWGEQEIVLSWGEEIVSAALASMNVPFSYKNNNTWALGKTPIHEVDMIDYAANERGNPTHWLELLWEKQNDLICIDVWYSSEKWWSSFVRRLFQRATIRDFLAKLRISNAGGKVLDIPLRSSEWYKFPTWAMERFFQIGKAAYDEWLTVE